MAKALSTIVALGPLALIPGVPAAALGVARFAVGFTQAYATAIGGAVLTGAVLSAVAPDIDAADPVYTVYQDPGIQAAE